MGISLSNSVGLLSFIFIIISIINMADNTETQSEIDKRFLENPPFWNLVNDSIEEFPTMEGKFIIDPWNYLQRQSLYKIILKKTTRSMKEFGPNNTGNMLWGLPLQHGWQLESGRLQNYDKYVWNCPPQYKLEEDFCISASSWWASMNYYLSIVPFIAALESGIIGYSSSDVIILKPRIQSSNEANYFSVHEKEDGTMMVSGKEYCVSRKECDQMAPGVLEKWIKFFEILSKHDLSEFDKVDRKISENQLLKYMWEAHVESLGAGLAIFGNRLQYMSKPEQEFGEGWANIVGYVASIRFATNFNNTLKFQKKIMPSRMLVSTDVPPHIKDFSSDVNRALQIINLASAFDRYSDGVAVLLWKRLMCTPDARKIGQQLMNDYNSIFWSTLDMLKLIWYAMTKRCTD